jgi:hypothetical protein
MTTTTASVRRALIATAFTVFLWACSGTIVDPETSGSTTGTGGSGGRGGAGGSPDAGCECALPHASKTACGVDDGCELLECEPGFLDCDPLSSVTRQGCETLSEEVAGASPPPGTVHWCVGTGDGGLPCCGWICDDDHPDCMKQ